MVFLMDITAGGKGNKSCALDGPQAEETRYTMLENLPPSIPNSRVYRKEDFICSKLSNGFYGDIFKVQHRETGEVMVLKMNKPDVELKNCTMLDEIKLMSHLSHPNVLRFIGVCISDSKVHLLCEFINGGELEELLLDYSIHLDWSTRLYLAKDIAEGMRYLHKQGVIHRDLTSKNCLIKDVNGWRYGVVADLGLATEVKEQSIVGSPFNMAPELLRGEAYDEKADVFSYGIILCEIIGRVPADPDELPRTKKFGVDVEKFQHMTGDCPNEFLQTALCCCQMEPSTRPTFVETSKHLEFILAEYEWRPEIDEAVNTPAPEPRITHSTPPPTEENQHGSEESGAVMKTNYPPLPITPAVIVSGETSPPLNIRSARENRRQSWIAGRYKMFNMATDDLLKNTPGKLKSFFHRALRIHTHFDPAKQKKLKEVTKQRSASHLKRYNAMDSGENGSLTVSVEDSEQLTSGSSESASPNTHSHRFLRSKNSEQDLMYNYSLTEDSVDGRYSLRGVQSDSLLTLPSKSHGHLPSSNELEVSQSCPWSHGPGVCSSPVCKDLENSNRPRCLSTPIARGLNVQSRRTASHGECENNNAYPTPQSHTEPEEGKHKNQKSPFWIFKRRSKFKESE